MFCNRNRIITSSECVRLSRWSLFPESTQSDFTYTLYTQQTNQIVYINYPYASIEFSMTLTIDYIFCRKNQKINKVHTYLHIIYIYIKREYIQNSLKCNSRSRHRPGIIYLTGRRNENAVRLQEKYIVLHFLRNCYWCSIYKLPKNEFSVTLDRHILRLK